MHHPQNRSKFLYETGDINDLPQEVRPIRWSSSGVIQIDLPAHEIPDPASSNFVLCLIRRGEAKTSFGFGSRKWKGDLLPGMFAPVTPPNVVGDIRLESPQRHLIVSFPSKAVASILGVKGDDLGAVHERAFRDPFLSQICLSLWEAGKENEPRHRLFEEYALAALVAGLSRRSEKLAPTRLGARPLSDADWITIETYIADLIDTDLSLHTLASLLGLSQYVFIRRFKARAGCAPHHYVLRCRIKYVQQLLKNTRLGLAEVALHAGFSDQAHMTSTFSRLTGTTPGQFRCSQ